MQAYEIKETLADDEIDMSDLVNSVGFLTRLAQVHTYEQFFDDFGEHGLRPGEFSTLLVIGSNPRIRQGVLAQKLRIKPAHMTKLIRAFEERGHVERVIPDHDRRSVELCLTDAGREFIDRHQLQFAAHEAKLPSSLTRAETETLKKLLRKYVGIDLEDGQ